MSSPSPLSYIFSKKIQIARKPHVCNKCQDLIDIGDRYQSLTFEIKEKARLKNHKTCYSCSEIILNEEDLQFYSIPNL